MKYEIQFYFTDEETEAQEGNFPKVTYLCQEEELHSWDVCLRYFKHFPRMLGMYTAFGWNSISLGEEKKIIRLEIEPRCMGLSTFEQRSEGLSRPLWGQQTEGNYGREVGPVSIM